jgi:hypothetical protein
MSQLRISVVLLAMLALSATTAAAQTGSQQAIPFEEPPDSRIGITMGYPASVGLIWHVTERLAVRPELSFSFGTTEGTGAGTFETSSDSWSVDIGVSALFHLRQWDALRTYVAPRFTYSRGESTVDSSSFTGTTTELNTSGVTIAGLFGASYALHPRFSVFGEVGVGFSDSQSTSSVALGIRTDAKRFGTQTGVGVVLYWP